MGRQRKSASFGLALLLACTLARVALGDPSGSVGGAGLVLEKDLTRQTVRLDGQIELQVTSNTSILDPEGNPITLAQLPVAPRDGTLVKGTGEATVRYQARLEGGRLIAETIKVLGVTID
jgi:hypothetical protein